MRPSQPGPTPSSVIPASAPYPLLRGQLLRSSEECCDRCGFRIWGSSAGLPRISARSHRARRSGWAPRRRSAPSRPERSHRRAGAHGSSRRPVRPDRLRRAPDSWHSRRSAGYPGSPGDERPDAVQHLARPSRRLERRLIEIWPKKRIGGPRYRPMRPNRRPSEAHLDAAALPIVPKERQRVGRFGRSPPPCVGSMVQSAISLVGESNRAKSSADNTFGRRECPR